MSLSATFRRIVAPFLALTLLLCASPSLAQKFPPLTGRVVDDAHLLSPAQIDDLTVRLAGLERDTARQLVVATIPDLQGYEIEDYGYRLGRTWGIGSKVANDGAILIVAPKEHKVRIEVGYGLEPILTDALSSVIIQTQILPAFRRGDMASGVMAGTNAIITQLDLPDDQARANAAQAAQQRTEKSGSVAPLIIWLIVMLFIVVPLFRRRRLAGAWPVMLWGPGFGGSGGGWGGGGGFSGGGGSFGGGGASGSW